MSHLEEEITNFVHSYELVTNSGEKNSLKESPTKYGQYISYKSFLEDSFRLSYLINLGLPYSLFREIQKLSPFSEKEWAEFLGLSTKSLQRYSEFENFRFKIIQSEKIIELAELSFHALEFFGDIAKFKAWLHTESFSFSGLKPIQLIANSYGSELVKNKLLAFEQGIFA